MSNAEVANIKHMTPRAKDSGRTSDNDIIFDNAPVAICYVKDRHFVKCNRRFEEQFGYNNNELDGSSVRILYPDNESFQAIWDKEKNYFKTNRNGFYIAERPMVRKNGTLIWCIISGRILDSDQPSLGAIWVLQDISDHKHLEEQLEASVEKLEHMVAERTMELTKRVNELNSEVNTRKKAERLASESERKYCMLFHMLPIGIAISTSDGQILEANQGFKELIGETTTWPANWGLFGGDFCSPDGKMMPKNNLPWLTEDSLTNHVKNIEVGMRLKRGGKRKWLSISSANLSLQDLEVRVTAFSDITYRKKIEELERLRHTELTRLARIGSTAEMGAALAHQMGQPLVSALNYLHGCRLRLSNIKNVDEISESIGLAIKHLEQAGATLGRVRDFVSKHKPDKIPADMNELVCDAITFLDFDIRRNNIKLIQNLTSDLPHIPICKIELFQVLFNLLKNSVEAMSDIPIMDRALTVRTELVNNCKAIRVAVHDHGEGIEKGVATRVFEPYFSTKPNGMGIGLTICRSIIESHDGELTYARAGKKGSIFAFTLPIE